MPEKLSPADLGALDCETFLRTFGGVFEHSAWVAEGAWREAPFDSLQSLHAAMLRACLGAPRDRQLALIKAHPDLAGKAAVAGDLTESSRDEQAGAGLDRLAPAEFARFQDLNGAYQAKFGFPFILAVKGHDKHSILASFAERLENDEAAEFQRALEEIGKIALFRLHDLIEG